MLARTTLRASYDGARLLNPKRSRNFQRRYISILDPFASGIVEAGHILSSLPLPASTPPYACAIVGISLALRMGITLPMALWSRARVYRREHIVGPELKAWREKTKVEVGQAFARDRRPYEEYREEMGRLQVAKIKELNKLHRCSPLPTMILPFAVHAPLFILTTASIRQAALMPTIPPNPLGTEAFLTLPSLSQVDPTGILPIAVGLVMFSNVELGRFSRPLKTKAAAADNTTGEVLSEQPRMSKFVSALENGLRGASLLFVWVAMQSPGAVVLYWLTSASYTFIERLCFINFAERRPEIEDVQSVSPPPHPTNSPRRTPARHMKRS